ncbi:MAG: RNA polymerase sigma factor [Chloroflexi bacterium]|nr:MAG: RNA polymerase sigma factor [Chloroflexota bacterium]
MAGPSRSARSSSTRVYEGALAIGPGNGDRPDGPGRRETAVTEAHHAIEAIWRIESARLIAGLARVVGDIGMAEELAQDALVAALEQWPTEGVPERPGAWLMGTAKHRAIDLIRRRKTLERKHEEIGRHAERAQEGLDLETAIDQEVEDDLLGLIFMACHPVLSTDTRVALTLRVLGGLTTEEIARAFLVPVSTIAQRIVRAKRTLAEAHVRFEVPGGAERIARLASVLEVIYLIFNEGYSATAGKDWVRPALCEEALRLGRIVAELVPTEPEVHGVVALMEIQASRLGARVGPFGEPVLLLDQDRARWDRLLIRRGLAALERAEGLGGALGPYALQAAIAACHARATIASETDWPRIVALYDAVAQLAPSSVVELNRAVAVGMAFGPAAGLELVDALVHEPTLKSYYLLPAVRGDLLRKVGRSEEARVEFERAASLTENVRERELLEKRAAECAAEHMVGQSGVVVEGNPPPRVGF